MKRHRLAVSTLLVFALVTAACSGAKSGDDDVSAGGRRAGEQADGDATGAGEATESTDTTAASDDAGNAAGGAGGQASTSDGGSGPSGPASGSGTGTFAGGGSGESAPPTATLFADKENRIGITDKEIRLCVHAALTYGAAFNTGEADLNVYWDAVNAAGGVHGRQVRVFYENDNYSPDTAVQAAKACKDNHDPFFVVGGIGFDQIPAVRTWAEANRMLYVHHTATIEGSEGQKFSYSGMPTTEKTGEMFAELAIARFKTKKIGIIKRRSPNWEPGVVGFKRLAKQHNLKIVLERDVQVNQGNYLQEILALQDAGAEVVWVWLNALETTELAKQARAQNFKPTLMVFPFNLTSQTLDDDALEPKMVGVGMYQAYSHHDLSGEFAKYQDDIKEFQAQYAKHRPSADLDGVGGDLIFLAWSGFKALHQWLLVCGPDCTRNKMLDVMHSSKGQATSSYCPVDFTRGDPHHGGIALSIMETYRAPDGKVNWRNTNTCVEHLI
jgi:ABC-type branched-subunit amino acid transport system substrate-binding protein/predicted small secreted protein